jgi:anti-anti-sigma factor
MNYQFVEDGSGLCIKVNGELNFSASTEFKQIVDKLLTVKGKAVVFDLANVTRIDSVGLGLLYIAKEELGGAGGKIRLKSPQNSVLKMLRLTEADADFDVQG